MRDIQTRHDLDQLLATFYNRLLLDERINYIFTDVAKIDLPSHLPHIAHFWEQSLFNTGGYRNNVLRIHQDLNDKEKLTAEHFKTWLQHLESTIDEMFKGPNAEKMKTRALSVATIMQIKL
ncbi:MAG TPA: group III truncated hemoglobin [Flavobacterium sp.]|jgi:hemoglobin